jgi:hypothetical protein
MNSVVFFLPIWIVAFVQQSYDTFNTFSFQDLKQLVKFFI